jgi:hypothetical protein
MLNKKGGEKMETEKCPECGKHALRLIPDMGGHHWECENCGFHCDNLFIGEEYARKVGKAACRNAGAGGKFWPLVRPLIWEKALVGSFQGIGTEKKGDCLRDTCPSESEVSQTEANTSPRPLFAAHVAFFHVICVSSGILGYLFCTRIRS